MPNVKSGASLTIHCIHSEIRKHLDKGHPRPRKIYIQIDGASDNTAKAVYASIEHLVAEGLCDEIQVWRLPVGHTHEDIGKINSFADSIKTLISKRNKFVIYLAFGYRFSLWYNSTTYSIRLLLYCQTVY
jgi:hypothetical protein